MRGRIPFDVQFLMESILSEDPDVMSITRHDIGRLIAKGAAVGTGDYDWENNEDAIAFWIDDRNKLVVFSEMKTHGIMDAALNNAAKYVVLPELFNEEFKENTNMGCIGIYSKKASIGLYFFGGGINNFDDVKNYLKNNRVLLRGLAIRDDDELCGRLWRYNNIVSFWNQKIKIDPVMKLMFDFMRKIKMDPEKCAYEFADSRGIYAYSELGGDVDEKDKRSAEELHALQAKKHLKKNKQDYGPEFWEKHGKKAAKGFDIAAKATAAVPALEGHIKLKDLLKENPDVVHNEIKAKIAHYYDGDAIAFFAFPEFSIINRGGVHYDMLNTMRDVYDILGSYASNPDELEYLMDEKGFILSNPKGLVDQLKSGPLGDYFENYRAEDSDEGGSSPNVGAFRTESGGLSGRVWTKKKIISFWNKKEDVVKRWNEIEKMFNDFAGMLGDLSEYRIDWLERDVSMSTPLTPASEVTSANSTESQSKFLDKLFGEKQISDEEIKKLQGRLHTMSAKEKKNVMIAMGYRNMKAAEIADKLGMTVAEFNHIMNVNEDTSSSS